MNSKQFTGIVIDLNNEFEKWYSENHKEEDSPEKKEDLKDAAIASSMYVVTKISTVLNDVLYEAPEDEVVPEGKAVEHYIEDVCKRYIFSEAEEMQKKEIAELYAKPEYSEYVENFILQLFRSYTGKPDLKFDEDDGVGEEEAAERHHIFDNLLFAVPAIKEGRIKKECVVSALRGLADFYEKEI